MGSAAGRGSFPWVQVVNVTITSVSAVLAIGIMALTIGPLALPYRAYSVVSGSMEPTLPLGSVVLLAPIQGPDVAVGNIITFQHPERAGDLVTHRVIGIDGAADGRFFLTKGDANGTQDSWRVPATGSGWRVRFFLPFLGYLLAIVQSPIGRLGFLVVPA